MTSGCGYPGIKAIQIVYSPFGVKQALQTG